MIGPRQVAQGALFYEFSIEDHVPLDHLLRAMDRFVNLGDMRRHLAPFYSSTGRPSVDPELMIRMLIVGYAFGIRSERRLCEEVHLNLAYRWFCRLDLSDPVPERTCASSGAADGRAFTIHGIDLESGAVLEDELLFRNATGRTVGVRAPARDPVSAQLISKRCRWRPAEILCYILCVLVVVAGVHVH